MYGWDDPPNYVRIIRRKSFIRSYLNENYIRVVERFDDNSSGFVENNLYYQIAYVLFRYKIIILNDEAEK